MEFAKLRSAARYNLATSGVMNFPLAELPVRLQDLEINGADSYGYPPLIEKLARRFAVERECVVTAQGTSMANHLAMAALLAPGDEALVEEPTYELLLTLLNFLGARVRRFARRFEDGFRIDPEEIRTRMTSQTRLIVITNLHNPSSALLEEATLREIGEIAEGANARVLVDEVYLEALFEKRPRVALHLGKQFVVTSSLTKGYGLSGLRCGWILAQPALAEPMWRVNDVFAATGVYPAEQLSAIALDHLQGIGARAKKIVSANRNCWNDFLRQRDDLECPPSAQGTTVFPRLKRGSVELLCEILRSKFETSVVPGKFFEMPQHFRVGLGGDPEMTAEGIGRLGIALKEFG